MQFMMTIDRKTTTYYYIGLNFLLAALNRNKKLISNEFCLNLFTFIFGTRKSC